MATIIERDVHHDSGNSNSAGAIVAIVAVVIIVGLALFVLRFYPLGTTRAPSTGTTPLNINVQGQLPGATNPTPTK